MTSKASPPEMQHSLGSTTSATTFSHCITALVPRIDALLAFASAQPITPAQLDDRDRGLMAEFISDLLASLNESGMPKGVFLRWPDGAVGYAAPEAWNGSAIDLELAIHKVYLRARFTQELALLQATAVGGKHEGH